MTSKERVLAALNHKEPDRVPVDFGGTAVTGIHVRSSAALRDHYGLEKRPVKVHEPYQMLGLVEDDLKQRPGRRRRRRLRAPRRCSASANEDWKPWRLDDGRRCWSPGGFDTTRDANGDMLIYPEGDRPRRPAAACPRTASSSTPSSASSPIDEDELDPGRQPGGVRADLRRRSRLLRPGRTREAADTGRAVIATFGGTAFGDIALVPAPFLKHPQGHPRHRGVVRLDADPAGLRPRRLRAADRDRPGQPGEDPRPASATASRPSSSAAPTSAPSSPRSARSAAFRELYLPYYKRINDWIHAHTRLEDLQALLRRGRAADPFDHRGRVRHPQPGPVLGRGHGRRTPQASSAGDIVFWGGGVDTQKTLPFGTPDEVRAEVRRAARDLRPRRRLRLQRHPQHPGQRPRRRTSSPCSTPCAELSG